MTEFKSLCPLLAIVGHRPVVISNIECDAKKLPQELSMFLMCKLNLLTTNFSESENDEVYQKHALKLLLNEEFIDRQTIQRLTQFAILNGPSIYFSRVHCFEMLKYLSIWGNKSKDPKSEFRISHVQRAFFRMMVTASEYHSKKAHMPHLRENKVYDDTDVSLLPVYRTLSTEAHSTTPIFSLLGRRPIFLDKYYFGKHQEYLDKFESVSGMSLQEYRDCALNLIALVISRHPLQVTSITQAYEYSLEDICSTVPLKTSTMARYLELESATPQLLQTTYKTDFESGLIDFRVFRPRPILLSNDKRRFTVIDLSLLAERATYGPFFHGRSSQGFTDFGYAFEEFLQDVFDDSYIALGVTEKPVRHCNTKNQQGAQGLELADAALVLGDGIALIQIKGSWLNEDHISLSAEAYWEKVQEKYCGGKKQKGIAQLGLSIKGILDGHIRCEELDLTTFKTIFPILLAHDSHLSINLFSHYFALDFCKIFGVSEVPEDGWIHYQGFDICAVTVMSLDDFELIECLKDKNLRKLLAAYSKWDRNRVLGFRNFMVDFWQRHIGTTSLYNSRSARAGLEYTTEMIERWFSKDDALRFKQSLNS